MHLNRRSFSCFQWGMHRWKLNTHSLISLTAAIAHLCSEYSRPCPVQTECPFVSRVVFHFEPWLRMTTQSPSKKKAVWTKVELIQPAPSSPRLEWNGTNNPIHGVSSTQPTVAFIITDALHHSPGSRKWGEYGHLHVFFFYVLPTVIVSQPLKSSSSGFRT